MSLEELAEYGWLKAEPTSPDDMMSWIKKHHPHLLEDVRSR